MTAWGISGQTECASTTLGVPRMSLWCPQGSDSEFGTHSFLATDFQLDLLLSQLLPLGVIFGQGCPLLLHLLLPLFLCRKGNEFKGFPGSFPINTGSQGQKVKSLSQTTNFPAPGQKLATTAQRQAGLNEFRLSYSSSC